MRPKRAGEKLRKWPSLHPYKLRAPEGQIVHLSNERMIVILLVGAAVGYVAGRVVRGSGFGLVGDAAVGVVGALLGNWLLARFGVRFVGGIEGLVIDSAIGATVLLLILRLVGASGWGGNRQ